MLPLRLILSIGFATALPAYLASSLVAAQPATSSVDASYRGYFVARVSSDGELEVIDELNPDRLFVPASVLKVITVAATLEQLGPDHRWTTRLTTRAPITNGALAGDLVIEPGADPTWNADHFDEGAEAPLAQMARQVRDRGVEWISGDLVIDMSRFPGRAHPLDRSFGDLPYTTGTPAAALSGDEATVTIRVSPGPAVGQPARVAAPDSVEVINETTTVGRDRHGAGTLDFVPVWGTDTLLLRGEYPISEPPFTVPASDPAPERRIAHRLLKALREAGVTLEGRIRVRRQPPTETTGSTTVAEFRSIPVSDLLEAILTDSHNWYADMLVLTLANEVAGTGRFDDGVEVVSEFAASLLDDDAKAEWSVRLEDGSGLARSNLVTPATVVRVLAHVLQQPWGRTVVGALAGPGEGTLEAWPGIPRIAAKTGTLGHTVTLAGILDPDTAAPVIFSYFVNHHPDRAVVARREIASALARWRTGLEADR